MWFHDLGFEENPFDENPNHKLVGYENIIEDVLYNIHAGNIVFLEGPNGSGKTAILKKAIQTFRGNGKVAYVECQKVKELNIENVLKGKYNFIERLFMPAPRDMIVLIDDINELDRKNTERLKYYYDQNYARAVILTGENHSNANLTDSLKDRIKKVIKLNGLKYYEAIDILNSRLRSKQLIPQEIIQEILERTESNRKRFLNACEELCKAIAENKETVVTMAHVDNLLPKVNKTAEKQAKNIEKPVKKSAGKKKTSKSKGSEELKVIYEGPEDAAERYY